MNKEKVISDELLNNVMAAIANGYSWFVYNTLPYFLDKEDMQFFKAENEANKWAFENNSKTEAYKIIHVNSVTDLYRELKYGERVEALLNHPKTYFMNQQNLDYLKENLRYMGFGDKLHADLEKNIQQGFPEFVLKMQSEFSGQNLETNLFFRKSDQSDLYFFNKYDAVLRNNIGTFEHSFYLNKGHGVTLKEAFNLLQGRAVYKEMENKEGQKFKAWIELDFKQKNNGTYKVKQYHDNYGYNLESTLNKFPIKELQNEQQKERLLSSLQRGNKQSVTMNVEGCDQMFFLQANPQFKTITVFDKGATRPLTSEQKEQFMIALGEDRTKINGKTVPGADGPNVQEATTTQKQETAKGENREISEKKSLTRGSEKKGKVNESKKEAVKNLLPQKQSGGKGKGQRV